MHFSVICLAGLGLALANDAQSNHTLRSMESSANEVAAILKVPAHSVLKDASRRLHSASKRMQRDTAMLSGQASPQELKLEYWYSSYYDSLYAYDYVYGDFYDG